MYESIISFHSRTEATKSRDRDFKGYYFYSFFTKSFYRDSREHLNFKTLEYLSNIKESTQSEELQPPSHSSGQISSISIKRHSYGSLNSLLFFIRVVEILTLDRVKISLQSQKTTKSMKDKVKNIIDEEDDKESLRLKDGR